MHIFNKHNLNIVRRHELDTSSNVQKSVSIQHLFLKYCHYTATYTTKNIKFLYVAESLSIQEDQIIMPIITSNHSQATSRLHGEIESQRTGKHRPLVDFMGKYNHRGQGNTGHQQTSWGNIIIENRVTQENIWLHGANIIIEDKETQANIRLH